MGDMDSGNSASIQSSSTACGNDQEFESHGGGGDNGGVFFNPTSAASSSFDNTASFQLYSLNTGSSTFNNFDPLPNNFDTNHFMIYHNHNNNNNHNSGDRTNDNDLGLVWPSSTSIYSPTCTTATTTTTTTRGPGSSNNGHGEQSGRAGPVSDQMGAGGAMRNPKKRSRASRRAPTTVLTTDTNNFRQMVQEFTGIPAPPFSGRTRLDLFGTTSTHHTHIHTPTPYLLRPFPQKIIASASNHLSINSSNLNPQSFINHSHQSSGVSSTAGLGPNAPTGSSLMSPFALGQVITPSPPTATTTCATTGLLPLRRGSVGEGGSSSENHRDATTTSRSEGMVDTWICSSD